MRWYVIGAFLAFWLFLSWYHARSVRRRLMRRVDTDWNSIASTEFPTTSGRVAVAIVVGSTARCLGIDETKVRPDDDITRDYCGSVLLEQLVLSDPSEGIVDAIRETLEPRYPRWRPSVSQARIREIIQDVWRHIEAAEKPRVS